MKTPKHYPPIKQLESEKERFLIGKSMCNINMGVLDPIKQFLASAEAAFILRSKS